jgi:hypothetical protein
VRRTSITSALLIAVLATAASACASGWGSQFAGSCPHTRRECAHKKSGAGKIVSLPCAHVLTPETARCPVRSFAQFHFAAFHAVENSIPLQLAANNFLSPSAARIIVSSVGSPETDRGPPRS